MRPELVKKYRPYQIVDLPERTWPGKTITSPPTWCSVDLRDGNQALIQPMSHEKKLEMFRLLLEIGFKEIEVGFPSASEVEFAFTRTLIEQNLIPDDVIIQVLTPARESLIKKTFESIKGASKAVIHLYNSTSTLQRRTVFHMRKKEIVELAVFGAKVIKEEAARYPETKFVYEYSPESFTGTELDFALEICEAVKDVWQPDPDNKMIINLPATVEMSSPNIYADQIEWFCNKVSDRDSVVMSLHTHNDRGCAVAATELALMAGGDRVEGTLFGNGERTGNVDIVTLALNMFTQGIDPGLDFGHINELIDVYERVTRLTVHPRQPYAGELVYTAFSGSHQDAIRKGIKDKDKATELFGVNWKIPYLHINPLDVGKKYEQLIRINSQSGKGGIAYILEKDFGLRIPKAMHPELGTYVQELADKKGSEISANEVYALFKDKFVQIIEPYQFISVEHATSSQPNSNDISVKLKVEINGVMEELTGNGNGPISAVVHALQRTSKVIDFNLVDFQEQSTGQSADSTAMAYITIKKRQDDTIFHGAGQNSNIDWAAIYALIAALNKAARG